MFGIRVIGICLKARYPMPISAAMITIGGSGFRIAHAETLSAIASSGWLIAPANRSRQSLPCETYSAFR